MTSLTGAVLVASRLVYTERFRKNRADFVLSFDAILRALRMFRYASIDTFLGYVGSEPPKRRLGHARPV